MGYSAIRRSSRKVLVVSGLFMAGLAALAPAAQALPGGSWASPSSPASLVVNGNWKLGEAYGTFQGVREDQGRGTRIQSASAHRHILDDPGGGDAGTYVKNTWYSNSNNCYVTSFSETGGGVGCSTGWWDDGYKDTKSTKSSSWQYWETWKQLDPKGSSMRDKLQVCENMRLWPDSCSTYYLRGADY